MRLMMTIKIPVEHGNKAFADGSMQRVLQELIERLKPEACYFMMQGGLRTALLFYEAEDDVPAGVHGSPRNGSPGRAASCDRHLAPASRAPTACRMSRSSSPAGARHVWMRRQSPPCRPFA
ncbi:MAG: hypothetical protein R3D25_13505 [Geminicoccaceae bacterium]